MFLCIFISIFGINIVYMKLYLYYLDKHKYIYVFFTYFFSISSLLFKLPSMNRKLRMCAKDKVWKIRWITRQLGGVKKISIKSQEINRIGSYYDNLRETHCFISFTCPFRFNNYVLCLSKSSSSFTTFKSINKKKRVGDGNRHGCDNKIL
jgi:hypothetical protein